MSHYYIAVIILNTVFSALLYFGFKKKGFSIHSLILMCMVSILTSLGFPFIISYVNLYVAALIGFVFISIGSYVAVRTHTEQEINSSIDKVIEVIEHNEMTVSQEAVETLPVTEKDLAEPKALENVIMQPKSQRKAKKVKLRDAVKMTNKEKTNGKKASKNKSNNNKQVSHAPVTKVDNTELCDSYIMRGFDAKMSGDTELAVKYFSSACELEPPFDLAKMLHLDIFAMYREIGQYPKAILDMEQFLKQQSPNLSPEEVQEIKTELKFTEFLIEMLAKANAPHLPYAKVPALIRVSVEEKINEWKKESY